jgi:hypothetical protein
MRFAMCGLTVTVITVVILLPAWAQTDQPTKRQGPTKRSEGRVSLAEEEVLIVLADEASRHFHEARADLFRHENIGAATELLKGAAFLKLEANLSSGKDRETLMAAIRGLDVLAYDMEMGGVVYVADFDREFAQAEAALADHHLQKAGEAWGRHEAKNTGLHLKAAMISLENGWGWSGQKPVPATTTAIQETDKVVNKLVSGVGWTEAEAKAALDKAAAEVGKLVTTTAEAKK